MLAKLSFLPAIAQFALLIGKAFGAPISWAVALSPVIVLVSFLVASFAYGGFAVLLGAVSHRIKRMRGKDNE